MKGMLDLDPSIDLTKPIWEQVFAKDREIIGAAKE
jgi:hypothetical protein